MIFNSENSLILRILIQTKCHKIPGSVLNNLFLLAKIFFTDKSINLQTRHSVPLKKGYFTLGQSRYALQPRLHRLYGLS